MVIQLDSGVTWTINGPLIDWTLGNPNQSQTGVPVGPTSTQAGLYGFDPRQYGAKGDAKTLTGCSIASGSANLVRNTGVNGFVNADIGKEITVLGAGAAASAMVANITAVGSATSITLSFNAASTVAVGTGTIYYGTNDRAAFQNAIDGAAAVGGRVVVHGANTNSNYLLSPATTTIVSSTPSTAAQVLTIPADVTIEGSGWGSALWFSTFMGPTTDAIRVTTAVGGKFGGKISNLRIQPQITNDGRNGIHFDFSDTAPASSADVWTQVIGNHLIEKVQIFSFGDSGIKVSNPVIAQTFDYSGGVFQSVGSYQRVAQYTGGYFTSEIRNSVINGHLYGINLDHAGDSIRIEGNVFPGDGVNNPAEVALRADIIGSAIGTSLTPANEVLPITLSGLSTTAGGLTVSSGVNGTFTNRHVGSDVIEVSGAGANGGVLRASITAISGLGDSVTIDTPATGSTSGREGFIYKFGTDGAHRLTIKDNNMTAASTDIWILGANSADIYGNNLEHPYEDANPVCDSIICIDGSAELPARAITIHHNHIGANTWLVKDGIRVKNAERCLIRDNNIIDSAAQREAITRSSGTTGGTWTYTYINNLGVSVTSAAIQWNDSTGAVATAICAMAGIACSEVNVTGVSGAWVVTLKKINYSTVTNGAGLTGPSPDLSHVTDHWQSIRVMEYAINTEIFNNTYPGGTQSTWSNIEDKGTQTTIDADVNGTRFFGTAEQRVNTMKWIQGYNQTGHVIWALQPWTHGGDGDNLISITQEGRFLVGGNYMDNGYMLQSGGGFNSNGTTRANGNLVVTGRPYDPYLTVRVASQWDVTSYATENFTLSAGGNTTVALAYNASAATVVDKLDDMTGLIQLANPAPIVSGTLTTAYAAGPPVVQQKWNIIFRTNLELGGSTFAVYSNKVRTTQTFRLGFASYSTGAITWSGLMDQNIGHAAMETQLNKTIANGGWGLNGGSAGTQVTVATGSGVYADRNFDAALGTAIGADPWVVRISVPGNVVGDLKDLTELILNRVKVIPGSDYTSIAQQYPDASGMLVQIGHTGTTATDGTNTIPITDGRVQFLDKGTSVATINQQGVILPGTTRANLSAAPWSTAGDGTIQFCTNCSIGADCTVAAVGTGALAVHIAGIWTCK